ncbi:MAG: M48 family metalloprotease [Steroidobacteraceae bacterium]|nr:M48 family metalloprotease [Steroidobacteraceae bacterium]
MNLQDFETRVSRMEQFAALYPGLYRQRVLAWAALGYVYLFVVMLVIVAVLVLSMWALKAAAAKLLILFVPMLFMIARAMWVQLAPPEGPRVTRTTAPALFELLDDLRRQLRTPRISEVVITPDLNAAVTQISRFGPFAGYRNVVMLGLPLMKGLTVEQFRAVLAHELGHLSRGHGRVGNWIYRMRVVWARLEAEFQQDARAGSGLILRFYEWYVPRFNALSFPLARANEYEADAASVRVTSPQSAAQALTGVNVLALYLNERYWPSIHAAARETADPVGAPFARFVGVPAGATADWDIERWKATALSQVTSLADTHPSLSDRLNAIGQTPGWTPPASGESADRLLGDELGKLEQLFDDQWREQIAGSWRQFNEELRGARERLTVLREEAGKRSLTLEEQLEWANAEARAGDGSARALQLRREAVERFPDSLDARFVLALQLTEADEAEGAQLLESILSTNGAAMEEAAAGVLRDYWGRSGDKVSADRWHERLVDAQRTMNAARRERSVLMTNDRYLPHGLTDEVVAPMAAALRDIPGIRRAYLVRKQTLHFMELPLYVLGYRVTGWLERRDADRIDQVHIMIQSRVPFPGESLILCVERPNAAFAKLFRQVPGSRLL